MRDSDWEIIVTLHKTGSINKTAEMLFLTQPALTKRLRSIEAELGLPLLIRTRSGSVFTPEGEQIAAKAAKICEAIQETRDTAGKLGQSSRQVIRVGFPYSFVRYVLPEILESYTNDCPNVDVRIQTLTSPELIKSVEEGLIDVCLARYNPDQSFLEKSLFSEDQVHIAAAFPLTEQALSTTPHIDYYKNPGSSADISRWWDERFPSPPDTRYRVTTADACLALVSRGLGWGYFLDQRYFSHAEGLYSMPLVYADGTRLTRRTWIFYRNEALNNPAVSSFISTVESFRQISED